MRTAIRGKDAEWNDEIRQEWATRVAPLFKDDETCSYANYFTPRPYVDEYNQGSDRYGFTYTVQPENSVCFLQWRA